MHNFSKCKININSSKWQNIHYFNRGHGRCTVFGYIFKFSWPPFFIEALYVGSMNWAIIFDINLFSRFAQGGVGVLKVRHYHLEYPLGGYPHLQNISEYPRGTQASFYVKMKRKNVFHDNFLWKTEKKLVIIILYPFLL